MLLRRCRLSRIVAPAMCVCQRARQEEIERSQLLAQHTEKGFKINKAQLNKERWKVILGFNRKRPNVFF